MKKGLLLSIGMLLLVSVSSAWAADCRLRQNCTVVVELKLFHKLNMIGVPMRGEAVPVLLKELEAKGMTYVAREKEQIVVVGKAGPALKKVEIVGQGFTGWTWSDNVRCPVLNGGAK
jgi:hypothetical protein